MPTYEYQCTSCGREFEVFQRMSDPPVTTCDCDKQAVVRRKIGRGAGIIFKGGGFYETDFKDKKGAKAAEKPSSASGSSESKTETKTSTPPASGDSGASSSTST